MPEILEEGGDDNADGRLQFAEVDKTYTIGLDVIAQAVAANTAHFFHHDGHGSTRALLRRRKVGESITLWLRSPRRR